jgi:hypothetical protein
MCEKTVPYRRFLCRFCAPATVKRVWNSFFLERHTRKEIFMKKKTTDYSSKVSKDMELMFEKEMQKISAAEKKQQKGKDKDAPAKPRQQKPAS